ncbi:hypothetical protein [Clavibacter californiensis]|uniref:hypothetical protein n=1 Tax=Clavibacter californiensis TaxID=1401995 RepID=UPI0011C2112A|nr:hypothetical protein [Clavibacter californiensis]UKF81668.1 hypothetical protein FGD68_15360 [Clavibacter californiensis]
MTDTQPDRPADLRTRRRAQPAPDERIDPVDYRREPEVATPPAAAPAATPAVVPAAVSTPVAAAAPAPSRGNTRREVAIPFSTRLAPDVLELIDRAVSEGRDTGDGPQTQRAVVEKAIRDAYRRQ